MDVAGTIAVAGTVAVIASVLVLARQARELGRQAEIANQVAGAETNREILRMFADAHRVFIDRPELRPHFFDQSQLPPSEHDQIRLRVVAELYADVLQVAIETSDTLAPFRRYADSWKGYIEATIASSSSLRSVIRDLPMAWPGLVPCVEAYDASHPAPRGPGRQAER